MSRRSASMSSRPAACEMPNARVLATTTQFTTREQQIVILVREGMTNKQIGRELGIVEDTVKKHLQHIYDKIGVRRRALLALGVPEHAEPAPLT